MCGTYVTSAVSAAFSFVALWLLIGGMVRVWGVGSRGAAPVPWGAVLWHAANLFPFPQPLSFLQAGSYYNLSSGGQTVGFGPSGITCAGSGCAKASYSIKDYFATYCGGAFTLNATASTACDATLNGIISLANAGIALLAIALILLVPHTVFMVLNAQKHAPGSTTADTPSCPTSCGASVPLVVFAFILSLVGLILCATSSAAMWATLYVILGAFSGSIVQVIPTNGPGLACAVIAMLLAFVSMILDSAARCACCAKRATPAALGGGTTIIIQNAAAPQPAFAAQQSYAMPGAPSAYSVSPAQKLAPGWTQAGPDAQGRVWYVGPNGESSWTAPNV